MSLADLIGEGHYIIKVNADGTIREFAKFEGAVRNTEKTVSMSSRRMATSLVALGASVSSLYFQFNNLNNVQIRVQAQANKVERIQQSLNKMIRDGEKGTEAYNLKLRELEVAQMRHQKAVGDVSQAYAGFAFNIAGVALQIPVAVQAIQALSGATAVLNLFTNKYVLIALAVIAAWEGFAQVLKVVNPELGKQLSIVDNINKMLGQTGLGGTVSGLSEDFDPGLTGSVDAVGTSLTSMASVGTKSLGVLSVGIGNVKSELRGLIEEIRAMNDEAGKQITGADQLFRTPLPMKDDKIITGKENLSVKSLESFAFRQEAKARKEDLNELLKMNVEQLGLERGITETINIRKELIAYERETGEITIDQEREKLRLLEGQVRALGRIIEKERERNKEAEKSSFEKKKDELISKYNKFINYAQIPANSFGALALGLNEDMLISQRLSQINELIGLARSTGQTGLASILGQEARSLATKARNISKTNDDFFNKLARERTAQIDQFFRNIKMSGITSAYSSVLHGNMAQFGGISQAEASNIVNSQANINKLMSMSGLTHRTGVKMNAAQFAGQEIAKGQYLSKFAGLTQASGSGKKGGMGRVNMEAANKAYKNAKFIDPQILFLAEAMGIPLPSFPRLSQTPRVPNRGYSGSAGQWFFGNVSRNVSNLSSVRDSWMQSFESQFTNLYTQANVSRSDATAMLALPNGNMDLLNMGEHNRRVSAMSTGTVN